MWHSVVNPVHISLFFIFEHLTSYSLYFSNCCEECVQIKFRLQNFRPFSIPERLFLLFHIFFQTRKRPLGFNIPHLFQTLKTVGTLSIYQSKSFHHSAFFIPPPSSPILSQPPILPHPIKMGVNNRCTKCQVGCFSNSSLCTAWGKSGDKCSKTSSALTAGQTRESVNCTQVGRAKN